LAGLAVERVVLTSLGVKVVQLVTDDAAPRAPDPGPGRRRRLHQGLPRPRPQPVGAENRVTAPDQRFRRQPASQSPQAAQQDRSPWPFDSRTDPRPRAVLAGAARPIRRSAKDVEILLLRHEVAVLR
jgi:hypothetical protein